MNSQRQAQADTAEELRAGEDDSSLELQRLERRLRATAALSGALSRREVLEAMVHEVVAALEGAAGVMVAHAEDGRTLRLEASTGHAPRLLEGLDSLLLEASHPLADAVREKEPRWIASDAIWQQLYPNLQERRHGSGRPAAAFVPLLFEDRVLGALGISFDREVALSPAERTFILALADQCARALERARLYEVERRQNARLAELVAERDRALEGMGRERRTLETLFRQAPALIAVLHGPEHRIALVNEEASRLLGRDDLIGTSARTLAQQSGHDAFLPLMDQVYRTGIRFFAAEAPVGARKFGAIAEERYFNVALQPVRGEAGEVTGLMVHAVEVTSQVRTRREVERLLAEQAAILSHITDGIVIADADTHITYMNPAAERMLGVPVLASSQAMPRVVPEAQIPLARAIQHEETILAREVIIERSDRTRVTLNVSATPLASADGQLLGGVATLRDVTRERELERQKDAFLSAAAHDLRTPLTAIKGRTQMLSRRLRRRGFAGDDPLLADLDRIDTTIAKMTTVISELLDTTRLEMGNRLDLIRAEASLAEVTQQAISERAVGDRIRLEIVADQRGSWDTARLERVLGNLLINALEYSADGSPVVVTVEAGQPGWARLTVRDHGIGIPADDLPHIFDRFYRGSNVSGRLPGTGIGLASVRQIVEEHGGTINVNSTEGQGTTFTIDLPCAPLLPQREGEG